MLTLILVRKLARSSEPIDKADTEPDEPQHWFVHSNTPDACIYFLATITFFFIESRPSFIWFAACLTRGGARKN